MSTPFIDLDDPDSGPRPTVSLKKRRLPLAEPLLQIATLEEVDLQNAAFRGDFRLAVPKLVASAIEIFQINLGRLCNMTCRHCHVDAGPDRWREVMNRETIDLCLKALDRTEATTVDLTGGAPELNPHFRYFVDQCKDRGKHVIDRCNLTVLLIERCRDLPQFFADRGVEVVCSLPHIRKRNTDAQRGDGAFKKSLQTLKTLNEAGYGQGDPERILTLMVNPVGAFLTGNQSSLEREWKQGLRRDYGLSFDRLIALNNMPIARYLEWLRESGNLERYMELLVGSFNAETVSGLMCRNMISVSWDGRIYDCDFNQMLALESMGADGTSMHIRDFDPAVLQGRDIIVRRHCFGCTAGAGSSCGGAIATV